MFVLAIRVRDVIDDSESFWNKMGFYAGSDELKTRVVSYGSAVRPGSRVVAVDVLRERRVESKRSRE